MKNHVRLDSAASAFLSAKNFAKFRQFFRENLKKIQTAKISIYICESDNMVLYKCDK